MKRALRFLAFIIIALLVYFLLFQYLDIVLNLLPGQSERVKYERTIKRRFDSETLKTWKAASTRAMQDFVKTELPFHQNGFFLSERIESFGFRYQMQEGETMSIQFVLENDVCKIFLDVYQVISSDPGNWILVASSKTGIPSIEYIVERSGEYLIKVQPEIDVTSGYQMIMNSFPSLLFPVKGNGNRAVQSFWGDPRDGGKRSHEGIDIFAQRGTPVLACVSGRISRIKTGGLGGKVVWLKSKDEKFSYYYAHLDSRSVQQGQNVDAGHELGKVGNTGNAITTPPHLHFGVYKSFGGPVDPFPFVKINDQLPQVPKVSVSRQLNILSTSRDQTPLRTQPERSADLIIALGEGSGLFVLGVCKDYYHVRTEDGIAGFIRVSYF
jgi:murein DD-endopeptidase MepM/ murein hydrolase activator NlpD